MLSNFIASYVRDDPGSPWGGWKTGFKDCTSCISNQGATLIRLGARRTGTIFVSKIIFDQSFYIFLKSPFSCY